jgi:hypothetical protein
LTKAYSVYFFGLGGLDSRSRTPLSATDGFRSRFDPWVFYLDQQRSAYPFRVFSVPFFRKLGRTGILMPIFPFQGQFFFSSPGRLRIRSIIWNRHSISRLLLKLTKAKLKSFIFLKGFPKLIRFFSRASVIQQLSWKNLFWSQLVKFKKNFRLFPLQVQRRFDLLFHPWVFSFRNWAFYTAYEKALLESLFSKPLSLKIFSPSFFFRMPTRFRKRFYYSVWISPSFDWHGRVNGLLHRPFPHFHFPSSGHFFSPVWLKQRPGLP